MLNGKTREDFEGLMAEACYQTLSPDDEAALTAWLGENPEARQEFEELKSFTQMLPRETSVFTGDLLPALKQEIAAQSSRPNVVAGPQRWFRWQMAAGLAAAAVLVVMLLQLQLPDSKGGNTGNHPVQTASMTPAAEALKEVGSLLGAQDFKGAYRTIRDTLATNPKDKASAGELQFLLANLEFSQFQQYDRAQEAYETLKHEYWDTAWRDHPQSATRLDLLAEAAQEDYASLYAIRRAVERGDAGFADLEQVLAGHAGGDSLVAALAVDSMRQLAGGLDTPDSAFEVAAYEAVRRRCTNPVAIAQLNHTLGEMYWTTIDDRAKAADLFEQVAESGHPQLAGAACERLDQLAALR